MRLCVQWPRLSPYHLARLRATHERFARDGAAVVALETAGADAFNAWGDTAVAGTTFGHEVLFPDRDYAAIGRDEMHRAVTAALDRLDPDAVAVNAYSLPDALACLAWCQRRRRAAVLMMESNANDAERSSLRERVKGRLIAGFGAALAGGTAQRRYLHHLGFPDARIFEPYDVVDNAFFRDGAAAVRAGHEPVDALPGLAGQVPFFLASNRFVARKNLERLIRAYARYRASAEGPWGLVLLGDGPLRSDLEALADTLGLAGVTFAGLQEYGALPAYYGRAGAFVHPALVEPWGLVVNEAAAAGLPVIVSDRAGCAPDLVRHGENGFAFDPEDVDGLTSHLAEVASMTPERRAAMGARSEALVARWSPERFADGMWAAVEAARAHRRPAPGARAVLWSLQHAVGDPRRLHTLHE